MSDARTSDLRCPACNTLVAIAWGIGPYCPNKECPRSDDLRPEEEYAKGPAVPELRPSNQHNDLVKRLRECWRLAGDHDTLQAASDAIVSLADERDRLRQLYEAESAEVIDRNQTINRLQSALERIASYQGWQDGKLGNEILRIARLALSGVVHETIEAEKSNAALPNRLGERLAFEKWLMEVHGLSDTWDAERNCYSQFCAHLAWTAWWRRAAENGRTAL